MPRTEIKSSTHLTSCHLFHSFDYFCPLNFKLDVGFDEYKDAG